MMLKEREETEEYDGVETSEDGKLLMTGRPIWSEQLPAIVREEAARQGIDVSDNIHWRKRKIRAGDPATLPASASMCDDLIFSLLGGKVRVPVSLWFVSQNEDQTVWHVGHTPRKDIAYWVESKPGKSK